MINSLTVTRIFLLVWMLVFSTQGSAALVDFTDYSWHRAINEGDRRIASIGITSIRSTGGNLTFNGGYDRYGCAAGKGKTGLKCDGDGIGVKDDEITQRGKKPSRDHSSPSSGDHSSWYKKKKSRYDRKYKHKPKSSHDDDDDERDSSEYYESIVINFLEPVDVDNIYLLDLFGYQKEIAIINDEEFKAPYYNDWIPGGFVATGFTGWGLTEVTLTGAHDWFSDYSLAAIEYSTIDHMSPVPLPGAFFLFGSALLGFFGFRRFRQA